MYSMILPGLYRIDTGRPSCLSYLVKTVDRNILIDPGIADHTNLLSEDLEKIGVKVRDIDIVINTHEHCSGPRKNSRGPQG